MIYFTFNLPLFKKYNIIENYNFYIKMKLKLIIIRTSKSGNKKNDPTC